MLTFTHQQTGALQRYNVQLKHTIHTYFLTKWTTERNFPGNINKKYVQQSYLLRYLDTMVENFTHTVLKLPTETAY